MPETNTIQLWRKCQMSGNQINAKVSIPNHHQDKTRKGPNRLLTFEIISSWIKLQGMDEYTTNGLIALAATYPTQALPSFRRNFNLMIARVRQQRQQEQRGEEKVALERLNDGKSEESEVQRGTSCERDFEGEDNASSSGPSSEDCIQQQTHSQD